MFSDTEKNKLYKLFRGACNYLELDCSFRFFFVIDGMHFKFNYEEFLCFIVEKGYISRFQYFVIREFQKRTNLAPIYCIFKILEDKEIFDIWYIDYLSEIGDIDFENFYKRFILCFSKSYFSYKYKTTSQQIAAFMRYVRNIKDDFKENEERAYISSYLIDKKEMELITDYLDALDVMITDDKTLEVLSNLRQMFKEKL